MLLNLSFSNDLAHRFDSLYQWLNRKYSLEQTDLTIANNTFRFFKIANMDAVLETVLETSPNPDEETPYWAEIWPSALALAQFISREENFIAGKKTLELGCGLGIAGIAAYHSGADIVLSDIEEDALRISELNWILNFNCPPQLQLLDWRNPSKNQQFEVILAADVAYETRLFRPLIGTFQKLLAPGGTIFLSEPNRSIASRFFEMLKEENFNLEKQNERVWFEGRESNVSVYKIWLKSLLRISSKFIV